MTGIGGGFGGRRTDSLRGAPVPRRASPFFPLIRSWAVGFLALYGVGYVLELTGVGALLTDERLSSLAWRLMLIWAPNLLCNALAGWVAARILPEAYRDSLSLVLLAALGAPVLSCAESLFSGWDFWGAEAVGVIAGTAVVGGGVGALTVFLGGAARGSDVHYNWGDSGATAVEYIGMLVVVVAIMVALAATALGKSIADEIKAKICQVIGGSCSTGTTGDLATKRHNDDAVFEPGLCNTLNISDVGGHEVKLGWFKIGSEYGFQKQDFMKKVKGEDGNPKTVPKFRITFSEAGKVGAAWKPKFGMEAGKFDEQPAKLELEGGVKVTSGDTFEFDSAKERDDFMDKLNEYAAAKGHAMGGSAHESPRANSDAVKRFLKVRREINDVVDGKKISYGTVSAEVAGNGTFELSPDQAKKFSGKLGAKLKVSPSVTVTHDSINNVEGRTYSYELERGNSAELGGVGLGMKVEEGGKRAATITVNRTPDGTLKSIIITHTSQTKGSSKVSGDASKSGEEDPDTKKKPKGKGGASKSDEAAQTHVVTNMIKFDDHPTDPVLRGITAGERKIADDWLNGKHGGALHPIESIFSNEAPTSQPKGGDEFESLMYRKGVSSKADYAGVTNAAEFGFDVNLGVADFGYKASFSKEVQRIGDAEFLGAPREDGTRSYVPFALCAK
ncbi:hypothetical protein V7793_07155 [Streptomyces sp. KLMMK]|uniref:Flp family type IVb pilin n=1 Tax=Streptomyces sp. KLMMK TaxID=3109353 RepID=UPI002FFFF6C5